jgi:hypothetical protein
MNTFTYNGREYRLDITQDDTMGHPWHEHDGHGVVRVSCTPHREGRSDKRPGERPLNDPSRNGYQYYYNWRATMRLALRDGWGAAGGRQPGETHCAYAARAVQADFDLLRRYLAGDIVWQCIYVTSPGGREEHLGGILDEWGGTHVMECAREQAEELEHEDNTEADALRGELREVRARVRALADAVRLHPLPGTVCEQLRKDLAHARAEFRDAVARLRVLQGVQS